ncbi:hypothetical protein EES42_40135 [Streptomyces sp. ADI95-17]|nr:hypothetical protein EES42_40135 [Streptomyces sp. ADI95-17]
MPIARPPSTTLRSPVRSLISAAFTPSSEGWPWVCTRPFVAGSRPAMALSRVDLPEPLEPIRPMASPLYAAKLTPFTACTSRTPGVCRRETIRLSAEVALPFPVRAPLTLYVMWTSSTTTVGTGSLL